MGNDRPAEDNDGMSRRNFLVMVGAAAAALAGYRSVARAASGGGTIAVAEVKPGEDVFAYISRVKGGFDPDTLSAGDRRRERFQGGGSGHRRWQPRTTTTRANARALLANTKIKDLHEHPLLVDDLQRLIWQTTDQAQYAKVQDWTMGQLKEFLLTASEPEIKGVMYGLTSDTIGCVPKLMSNQELIALGQKIFNVVPGTRMGAKGYMGARIQPNSPTDHPDDVVWQVFDAFAYATGDIVIGTNPVDSTVAQRRRGREGAQGHRRHLRAGGHDSLVRALPYRRPGRGGRALSGNGRHDVPEPRRHRRLQQDVRRHGREDPEVRNSPSRANDTGSTSRPARVPNSPMARRTAST